ncbi:MAG: copper resistance CopC family protein, partial [Ilumatobacteraceae bacterium]
MVVLSVPGTADAHNALESSSPSPGEVVAVSPPTWTLDFTSPVPLESASGEVVLADGSRLDLDAPVHGASDRSIVFTLPAALAGSVTARWRLVGTDGHVISGRVPFTVGQSPAVVQPTATSLTHRVRPAARSPTGSPTRTPLENGSRTSRSPVRASSPSTVNGRRVGGRATSA